MLGSGRHSGTARRAGPRNDEAKSVADRDDERLGPAESAQKRGDRIGGGIGERGSTGGGVEAKQALQMDLAPHQRGELLGGEPRVVDGKRAGLGGAAQKALDLIAVALGAGLPEHLAERREAGHLADD